MNSYVLYANLRREIPDIVASEDFPAVLMQQYTSLASYLQPFGDTLFDFAVTEAVGSVLACRFGKLPAKKRKTVFDAMCNLYTRFGIQNPASLDEAASDALASAECLSLQKAMLSLTYKQAEIFCLFLHELVYLIFGDFEGTGSVQAAFDSACKEAENSGARNDKTTLTNIFLEKRQKEINKSASAYAESVVRAQERKSKPVSARLVWIICITVTLVLLTVVAVSVFGKTKVANTGKDESDSAENLSGEFYRNGDKVRFGEYPQTEVTDEKTLSKLEKLYQSDANAEYYLLDDVKYKVVSSANANKNSVYYNVSEPKLLAFRYEALKYRVLDEGGDTLTLLCENVVAACEYAGGSYGDSPLCGFFAEFASDAFGDDIGRLAPVTLDNGDSEFDLPFESACFTLSLSEARDTEYGFSRNTTGIDLSRTASASDYAVYLGAPRSEKGVGVWWLRTEGMYVGFGGGVSTAEAGSVAGIRPAVSVTKNAG